jgi:lipopolysaccharide heptosyltransferase II
MSAAVDPRWQSVRRLLAVRLDNLGDLLMTTPALAAIRESLPEAHVTLLASDAAAAAADRIRAVDEAIAFRAPWMKTGAAGDGSRFDATLGLEERRFVEMLCAGRFDAAVVFTVCTQSALPAALMCRLAGIRLRLAYSRENPYGLLTDWVPDTDVVADGMRHEVVRQLALVGTVGMHTRCERLRLHFGVADVQALQACMRSAGIEPVRPYFVIHPGASAPSRRYPPASFAAAADIVSRSSGCRAVYAGAPGDVAAVEAARAAMTQPSASLAGALDLGGLAALIAGAQVLLANNSAPAHIAAAVGTPVVDLYALTNPQHTPWGVPARVLNHGVPCRNCLKSECPAGHHDCLRRVEPAAVAAASLELMGSGRAHPSARTAEPARSVAQAGR